MQRPSMIASITGASELSPHGGLEEQTQSRVLLTPRTDATLDRLCSLVADYFGHSTAAIFRTDGPEPTLVSSYGIRTGPSPELTWQSLRRPDWDIITLNGAGKTYKFTALRLYDIRDIASGWLCVEYNLDSGTPQIEQVIERFARVVESTIRQSPPATPFDIELERCSLTGLLNRSTGLGVLERSLAEARVSGAAIALIIADIADFNAINSAFGRTTGDKILRAAAQRVADIAPDSTTVFRLNGDQFGMILQTDSPNGSDVETIIGNISQGFAEPVRAEEREVVLCFVFGTAFFPHRANSTPELIDRAILALRRAQERRSGAEVFTTELEERLIRDVAVEQRLRSALGTHSITVAYQPKILLHDGSIYSIEALARWIDDELGFVSPGEFIPAAERSGLIVDLGSQVLKTALNDIVSLREHHPHLTVSVNVAAAQLQRDEFVDEVLSALEETGTPAEALELEVVETSLIENIDRARQIVTKLRTHGITFSIDDFGTGYSSLAYLRQLPVQTLKIDREFVGVITDAPRDAALVESIISMAHVLNFKVVAEGVETEEQAKLLQQFNCDAGQGYLWAKPLPIDALRTKLAEAQSA